MTSTKGFQAANEEISHFPGEKRDQLPWVPPAEPQLHCSSTKTSSPAALAASAGDVGFGGTGWWLMYGQLCEQGAAPCCRRFMG